jgi:hypothetical protein
MINLRVLVGLQGVAQTLSWHRALNGRKQQHDLHNRDPSVRRENPRNGQITLDNLLACSNADDRGCDRIECFRAIRSHRFILCGLAAVAAAIKEWLQQWVTEIVVTDRRVIYKTGLIQRHTAEMNMDKVESVIVDQSILGRLLDYGSIHIRGTGVGLEHLHYISSPVSFEIR